MFSSGLRAVRRRGATTKRQQMAAVCATVARLQPSVERWSGGHYTFDDCVASSRRLRVVTCDTHTTAVRGVVGVVAVLNDLDAFSWEVIGDGGRPTTYPLMPTTLAHAHAPRIAGEYGGPEPVVADGGVRTAIRSVGVLIAAVASLHGPPAPGAPGDRRMYQLRTPGGRAWAPCHQLRPLPAWPSYPHVQVMAPSSPVEAMMWAAITCPPSPAGAAHAELDGSLDRP